MCTSCLPGAAGLGLDRQTGRPHEFMEMTAVDDWIKPRSGKIGENRHAAVRLRVF